MSTIFLGNTAPIDAVKPDEGSTAVERISRSDIGKTITTFVTPGDDGLGRTLTTISQVFRSHHSDEPPAWVESDDNVIAEALSKEFGCPVGRPSDWPTPPTEDIPIPENAPVSEVSAESSGVVVTPSNSEDHS